MQENRLTAMLQRLTAAAALLLLISLSGCGKQAETTARPEPAIDLAEMFYPAGNPENFRKRVEVLRRGERKLSFNLVAPVRIEAPVKAAEGRRVLRFWAAPIFNIGDGFLLMVYLSGARGRSPVAERYFDPAASDRDRSWVDFTVPLGSIEDGSRLEFEVTGGPRGDLTADWLAISEPRLEPEL